VWSLQSATGTLSFAFADLYKVKLARSTQTLLLAAFDCRSRSRSDVPAAHLAAGRARRGADRGSVILAGVLLKMARTAS